jgi:glycosyltransferase involved in cell wall biosynthesis
VTPGAGPPHLLYVAWGFPPCRSGGVHRALATANAFAAAGWDVTVLTVPVEVFHDLTGADDRLLAAVDDRVVIERIRFAWPARDTDLHHYPLRRVLAPRLWARARRAIDLLPFPEYGYGPWRRALEAAAERVHARRPVDLAMATMNPQVSLTAPWHLHRRHGVPYVLDYRDAWSLDVFSGERVHAAGSRVGRWERAAFAGAREVWFVNEPIRRWHAEAYPAAAERLHVVANGFDTSLPQRDATPGPEVPLRFGYLGTLTSKVPLPALVDGWRTAVGRVPELADATADIHGYLGHYVTPDAALLSSIDAAADAGMAYRGPVSKAAVADVYAGLDALLLVLGTGRYVTSGKVFEYLSTGLPVVSVHDPANAASQALRGYPRWHPARDLSAGAVAEALAGAARDAVAHRGPRPDAVEFAARYRRDRQLAPRIAALRRAVAPPGRGGPVRAGGGR